MSRLNKTFKPKAPVVPPPTMVNRDGYPAWSRPLDEQYLQTLLTNTFGGTFYADAKTLVAESAQVHDAMLAKDPAFAANALVYARQKGFMRSQPVYGLAKLAGVDADLFKKVFPMVIKTPNDLRDFFAVISSLRKGEGGRAIKKAAGDWIVKNLSEYWAIKYGSGDRDGYSLADLIKVSHPNYGGAKMPLVSYLFGKGDRDAILSQLPQVAAFEALKKATTDKEKIDAITKGRLPHEVASTFAGTSTSVWKAIVAHMPIFALLRNLATIERHGVLPAVRAHILKMFSDEAAIAKSMILPYRFLEASKHVKDSQVVDALRDAVELSFANVPDVEGRLAVFLDISGSMAGDFLQKASLFAFAAMKKAKGNGRFLVFDTSADDLKFSTRDSILTQASRVHTRGGTDTSCPMKKLTKEKDRVDTILLVTDEQQNAGSGFYKALLEYQAKVNRKVVTMILDIAPYRSAVTPDVPGVYYSYGWSDTALSFLAMASKGWDSQVEAVRKNADGLIIEDAKDVEDLHEVGNASEEDGTSEV
jgi:60 kDa SS-A/Ro ribonucleoprotein